MGFLEVKPKMFRTVFGQILERFLGHFSVFL